MPSSSPTCSRSPIGDAVRARLGPIVVERQLEAGDHEQVVGIPGAFRLGLDRGEVVVVVARMDVVDGGAAGDRVIGHAEHVEAGVAVDVDQLGKRERAVAPGRVRVQLAEQRMTVMGHARYRRAGDPFARAAIW